MAQRDLLKRYLDAGMSFTAMTKSKAEAIVKELVRAGEVQRDQVQSQVDELIERSRRNSDNLVALVRKEVSSQLADLTTTVRDELRALERRVSGGVTAATNSAVKRAPGPSKASTAAKAPGAKKAAKKAAATVETAVAKKAPAATKARAASKAPAVSKAPPATKAPAATKRAGGKKAPAATTGFATGATAPASAPAKKAPAKKAAPATRAPSKKAPAKKAADGQAPATAPANPAASDAPSSNSGSS